MIKLPQEIINIINDFLVGSNIFWRKYYTDNVIRKLQNLYERIN